jgi:methionyl-tRNA synthetase
MAKEKKKRILVCAAWPYVHAVSHLGNVVPFFSADVLARFYRLKGCDVEFVSGSDQHGAAMEFEAKKLGVTPQQLVDKNHAIVEKFNKEWGMSFTNYSRTTHPMHKQFVTDFYKKVFENGHIEIKDETLPFCTECDQFLPDRFVTGSCPFCSNDKCLGNQCDECGRVLDPLQLVDPKCSQCGTTPVTRETKTGYFKLSKFLEQLKKYVKEKKPVWQPRVVNFTERWFEEGLNDRPVTRDLKWGIPCPFPGLEDKTIYVWAEAVLGYCSTIFMTDKFKQFWETPVDHSYFCLGKDNIPFHTIIFPSLLMGHENLNLPDVIVSNEYIGFEGKQFSKTRGVGIWIDEVFGVLEPDYWRYYLLRIFPETKDTDFSWKDFDDKINNELVKNLSNFINRVINLLNKMCDAVIPEKKEMDSKDRAVYEKIKECKKNFEKNLELGKVKEPLEKLMALSKVGNEYLQTKEPWKVAENKDCLAVCSSLVKALAIFAEPYLPFTSEKIKNMFNFKDLTWDDLDEEKLKAVSGKVNEPVHMFDRINVEKIQKQILDKRLYGGFKKLDLRVAKVTKVENHPNADKLYVMQIDLGKLGERQIVSGLKDYYKPEELEGKNIVIIANLKESELRGVKSKGMLLAAIDKKKKLGLLVARDSAPGDQCYLEALKPTPAKIIDIKDFQKLKMTVMVGRVMFKDKMLKTDKEDIIAENVADGAHVE